MYDAPKAIHFDAYKNGVKLHDRNLLGIRCRWSFAHSIRSEIEHMDGSEKTLTVIRNELRFFNADNLSDGGSVIVTLAGEPLSEYAKESV